jgi:hypothetical protein
MIADNGASAPLDVTLKQLMLQFGLSTAPAGASGGPSNLMALLNPNQISGTVNEYALGPASNASVTLFSSPTGTSGQVSKIKIITEGGITTSPRLRISYDGGVTFPFDAELATLAGSQGSYFGQYTPSAASCAHMTVQVDAALNMFFEMTYPVPYSNGVLIQLYSYNTNLSGGLFFSEVTNTPLVAGAIPPVRLKCTSTAIGATGASNIATVSGGFTLTNPNVPMNGTSGNLAQGSIQQMANLTGAGWIAGVSYVDLGSNTNFTSLERNFGWYIDGATPPIPSGTTIQPTNGQISGTQVGSPTLMTSGTEDTFDSAFYGFNTSVPVVGGGPNPPTIPPYGNLSSPPAFPASTATPTTPNFTQNDVMTPVDIYIGGGSITAVAIDGVLLPNVPSMIRLAFNETIGFTYTGSPSWKWFVETTPPVAPSGTPNAMVMSNMVTRAGVWASHLDLLSSCGGYKFNSSLQLWLLTEGRVTTSHTGTSTVLYYQ